MTIDLDIVLPSGQTACLEVEVYPDEIEVLDLETGSEWEPASDEDWNAVQAAVSKATANKGSYSDEGGGGDDWWSGDDREPEIMGLDEYDRGW